MKLTYHKYSLTFPSLLIQIRAEKPAFFPLSWDTPHSFRAFFIVRRYRLIFLSAIATKKKRFIWSWLWGCCWEKIFLVVSKDNLQKSGNDNSMMATKNITGSGTQTTTFEGLECSPVWVGELKQQSVSFSAVNVLLSITATLGNSLILVALHKESSLHPPSKLLYRCLATTDLLVGLVNQPLYAAGWMSVVYEHWSFCRYARDATVISSSVLCVVSLMTMTAISVDRLLAMLLGLRYKEIVTLRRTYIILAIFWIVSLLSGLFFHLNYRITFWLSFTGAPLCLVISIASYTKIFRAISHHQAQIQDYAQQQPSQPNALNMARYRKAVYNAIWVQLALVVCYFPQFIVRIVIFLCAKRFSNLFLIYGMGIFILFFNSTLNPFLYCWKISEVRRAVKQTIRQAICYAKV